MLATGPAGGAKPPPCQRKPPDGAARRAPRVVLRRARGPRSSVLPRGKTDGRGSPDGTACRKNSWARRPWENSRLRRMRSGDGGGFAPAPAGCRTVGIDGRRDEDAGDGCPLAPERLRGEKTQGPTPARSRATGPWAEPSACGSRGVLGLAAGQRHARPVARRRKTWPRA